MSYGVHLYVVTAFVNDIPVNNVPSIFMKREFTRTFMFGHLEDSAICTLFKVDKNAIRPKTAQRHLLACLLMMLYCKGKPPAPPKLRP